MRAAADVLVVLHDLALGGTERVALRLAGAWVRQGRRVRLLCGDGRGPAAAWLDPGVAFTACDPPIPRGPGALVRLARATARELAARPAAVLFVPGNHHWPVVAAAAALPRESRPALVAQVSNPLRRPDRPPWRRALAQARARRRLTGADALVTLTEAEAREADQLFGRALAHRIPLPALDDDAPAPCAPAPGPPEVLCLGRLVAQKGFDLAIDAFAETAPPGARLTLVGGGPERAALESRARRRGVGDRTVFAGTAADARAHLDRARVLLMPSRFEGYGSVVVEALAAGRPVVASDRVPAAVELVDRPSRGAVIPFGDAPALARALRDVATAPYAPPGSDGLNAFQLGAVAAAYLTVFDAQRG